MLGSGGAIAAGVYGARPGAPAVSAAPLRRHAALAGMSFGMSVSPADLARAPLARLIAAEADTIEPGNTLKWSPDEPKRGQFVYQVADNIADFAKAHRLRMRGHTAFWWRSVPKWAVPLLAVPGGRDVVLDRIRSVVGHFRGRILEWDVMNEVIEPRDGAPMGLRMAPFGRPVDIGFYVDCFRAAHQADPHAKLYYNEYGIECDAPDEETRRRAVLGFLGELRRRGAPIHGFGIQSHLATYRRFDPGIFRTFLRDVAALGLEIGFTEFDVADSRAPGEIPARDAAVADYAARFLDTGFDERAVKGLVTWGTVNGASWLQGEGWARRADATPLRPLPFDDQYRRTPLWQTIARAYDGAPRR